MAWIARDLREIGLVFAEIAAANNDSLRAEYWFRAEPVAPGKMILIKRVGLFPHHFGLPRMRAGPLRQNEETAQYKSRDNRRGKWAA
jgi:hypothetical protein